MPSYRSEELELSLSKGGRKVDRTTAPRSKDSSTEQKRAAIAWVASFEELVCQVIHELKNWIFAIVSDEGSISKDVWKRR